jgi:hypothetical protein
LLGGAAFVALALRVSPATAMTKPMTTTATTTTIWKTKTTTGEVVKRYVHAVAADLEAAIKRSFGQRVGNDSTSQKASG